MAERILVRGTVQGVGFRPHVVQVARARGLAGFVHNDARGVVIALDAAAEARDEFLAALLGSLPPLARVESVELASLPPLGLTDFSIADSTSGAIATEVGSDAATCEACVAELRDPYARRYRYPFTACTHCGPRYSVVRGIPYDRANTTLSTFPLCPACRAEYEDVGDRRFHAQAMACHACGPRAWLVRADGRAFSFDRYSSLDEVDAVGGLILHGEIVALRGLGGYQLLCDATRADVVARLRERKGREAKPFALMARDLSVVERFAEVGPIERAALLSPAAPIVLLPRRPGLPDEVAPGTATLGFMLPSTGLHHLALRRVDRPVVCTSGNASDEPQALEPDEATRRLREIADWFLHHDRPIHTRVDDSVVRVVAGEVRTLRRARGYAPEPLAAPPGFERAPSVLALGAQLKSTICLLQDGRAIVSQHLGDLDHALAADAWTEARGLLSTLYQHQPTRVAVDAHPEYRATQEGQELAAARGLPVDTVLHHHAHLASCLFENGYPLDGPPVLGITLDGIGLGEDGELWGGEFLLGGYAQVRRVATIKPVALLGGDRAAREPWRNLYAHLMAELGWAEVAMNFGELPVIERLAAKPRALLDQVLAQPALSPRASSTGRLFDAVAAALGLHFDGVSHEGQAAIALEALATRADLEAAEQEEVYPIGVPRLRGSNLPYIEPMQMWRAILGDLYAGESPGRISARFHVALCRAITRLAEKARTQSPGLTTVALSGGVWQNATLLDLALRDLARVGFSVLTHRRVPANDGGISLGQAAVAAARALASEVS